MTMGKGKKAAATIATLVVSLVLLFIFMLLDLSWEYAARTQAE